MSSAILKDKSFRIAIMITFTFFIIGIIFLLTGLADYSWILFIVLPVAVGISIGALPNRKWAIIGAVLASLLFLFFLLIGQLSGFICVIMCIPIILPLLFLGSTITFLAKRYKQIKSTDKLHVLVLPLLVFMLAAPTERMLRQEKKQVVAIETVQVFDYTPMQVYESIVSVDTLTGEKPFLMKFDLPVPTKCVLESESVGGLRTCHFNGGNLSGGDFGGGRITEKITQLERGKVLKMDVIDCNLIGRKWLGFKEAIYYFEDAGSGKCRLRRITTYTSELTPRFYWAPLEKWGISEEHDYVFSNLANDLKRKHRK